MTFLSVGQVTINSVHPKKLAEFYAKIFGGTIADYGNGYIGINNEEGRAGFLFQQADKPSLEPGWIHLDCILPEEARNKAGYDAAVKAITDAGGKLIEERGDSNFSWTVFEDPDGNPFCIPTGGH